MATHLQRIHKQLSLFESMAKRGWSQASQGFASEAQAVLGYEETQCLTEDRSNEATGIIVHGLLGSGRNWRTFSKVLAATFAQISRRPWRFLLVDQRCHGRSLGIGRDTDPSTVGASARDLGKFIDAKLSGRSIDFLAGHSLGGKVVLDLLQQQRHDPPTNQAWILDSVVGRVSVGNEEPTDVWRVLEEVDQIPAPISSREWLYSHLEERGFSPGFRQWMGSNLQPHEGQYRWTFDITCAKELYQSYQDSQYWHLVESPPEGLQLNLVRAANSDRWSDKQWTRLQEAEAASQKRLKLHVLENAGHWLHADNPDGLRQLLCQNLIV